MLAEQYGIIPGSLKEALSKSTAKNWKGKDLVVQVTNSKVINEQTPSERRYRCVLSDGQYSVQGLIDSNSNAYLEGNGFSKLSVVAIRNFSVAKTLKRILIITDIEVKIPRTEKIAADLITLDSYFDQHPEEDVASENSASSTPAPPIQHNAAPVPQKRAVPERPTNPIESLSPYQNQWTIKARVSYKGDIRTWSNARGEGKLFNVNFLDESDEIRATAFNDVAEKFFNLLEEGKVYYVTRARINQAKPQFSHLSHPYELSMDKDTEITECFDSSDVPKINFNFTKLDQIQNSEPNTIIDVIGVLKEVNPVFQITAKSTGKPFDRRNITIVDDSNFAITVGLWNQTAVDFSTPEGSVIAFKQVKVQEFGGKSLSLTPAGTMLANPDTAESYQLKGWYDNQGVNENFQSLKTESSSNQLSLKDRKTIFQAQQENLGMNDKPDFFAVKASINYFKADNFSYPACNNDVSGSQQSGRQQQTTCNRKVIEQSDGTWRCEKCNINFPEPYHRYILNASVMDATGQIWLTFFDQDATKLFGKTAGELKNLKDLQDQGESNDFQDLVSAVTLKELTLRVKARQDSYNGQVRVRYQVVGSNEIDFNTEAEFLVQELDSLL